MAPTIVHDAEALRQGFRALIEHSSDVLVVIDVHEALIYANPAASDMMGVADGDAVGALACEFIHPDDVERIMRSHVELLGEPGSSRTETFRVVDKHGDVRFIEAVATNCLDIPAVAGIVVNGRDVTERHTHLAQIEASLDAVVVAVANAVELRDPYTAGHQREVAEIAGQLARHLGLPAQDVKGIEVAATLHDIGKIAVPAEILARPSRLSPPELEIVKGHAEAGYRIVADVPFPWPVATMILQHHERFDGSGYPRGLGATDVLLGSRILAVADVVSAMSEHRPYRSALGLRAAMVELEAARGRLFDPIVVDACLELARAGSVPLRAG